MVAGVDLTQPEASGDWAVDVVWLVAVGVDGVEADALSGVEDGVCPQAAATAASEVDDLTAVEATAGVDDGVEAGEDAEAAAATVVGDAVDSAATTAGDFADVDELLSGDFGFDEDDPWLAASVAVAPATRPPLSFASDSEGPSKEAMITGLDLVAASFAGDEDGLAEA